MAVGAIHYQHNGRGHARQYRADSAATSADQSADEKAHAGRGGRDDQSAGPTGGIELGEQPSAVTDHSADTRQMLLEECPIGVKEERLIRCEDTQPMVDQTQVNDQPQAQVEEWKEEPDSDAAARSPRGGRLLASIHCDRSD